MFTIFFKKFLVIWNLSLVLSWKVHCHLIRPFLYDDDKKCNLGAVCFSILPQSLRIVAWCHLYIALWFLQRHISFWFLGTIAQWKRSIIFLDRSLSFLCLRRFYFTRILRFAVVNSAVLVAAAGVLLLISVVVYINSLSIVAVNGLVVVLVAIVSLRARMAMIFIVFPLAVVIG